MTWQEELRKLDEDFSTGRITADQYRKRRDQVLSSAATQQPPDQNGGSNAEATQVFSTDDAGQATGKAPQSQPVRPPETARPQQPGSPQQSSTTGAPAQPGSLQQAQNSAERTQFVPPSQPPSSQAPQAPSPPQQPRQAPQPPQAPPPQAPPQGFPQAYPQQPMALPPGAYPQQHTGSFPQQYPWFSAGGFPRQHPVSPVTGFPQQQPGWHAPMPYAAPPWARDEYPPVTPAANQGWPYGQEDWRKPHDNGRSGKLIVTAVVGALVAGLTIGGWWLWFQSADQPSNTALAATTTTTTPTSTTTTTTTTSTTSTTTEPKNNADALVKLPGKTRPADGRFDIKRARKDHLLPSSILSELREAKLDSGLLHTTDVKGTVIELFAMEFKKHKRLDNVADAYAKAQRNSELARHKRLSTKRVRVFSTGKKATPTIYRAVYRTKERMIILATFGKKRAEVREWFKRVLERQVDQASPTG